MTDTPRVQNPTLNHKDLERLQEPQDFRNLRLAGQYPQHSWLYFIPTQNPYSAKDKERAQDISHPVEIRYIDSDQVAIDLNPNPRPLQSGTAALFETRASPQYFKTADLIFNKLTGKFEKTANADAADSAFTALATLEEQFPDLKNPTMPLRDYLQMNPQAFARLQKAYSEKLDLDYLEIIIGGVALPDPSDPPLAFLSPDYPFDEYVQALVSAEAGTRELILNFLLDAAPVYFAKPDPWWPDYMPNRVERYCVLLRAAGYRDPTYSDRRLKNLDIEAVIDAYQNSARQKNTDDPKDYRTPCIDAWRFLYEQGVIDEYEILLSPKTIELFKILNKEEAAYKRLGEYTLSIAQMLAGESQTDIPLANSYLLPLSRALKANDETQIRIAIARINDELFVPQNYGLIYELNPATVRREIVPVAIVSTEIAEMPMFLKDDKLWTTPYTIYRIRNLFDFNTRFASWKYYALTHNLSTQVTTSHFDPAYRDYAFRTGHFQSFLGPKILEEQFYSEGNLFKKENLENADNSNIVATRLRITNDKTSTLGQKGYIDYNKLLKKYFTDHEVAHLADNMHHFVKNKHDETYADLVALAQSDDPRLLLYYYLKRSVVYEDQNNHLHLKGLVDKDDKPIGFAMQMEHEYSKTYFFARLASDKSQWDGKRLLGKKEDFIDVYTQDPVRFEQMMLQILEKLGRMSDAEIKGLAQHYAEGLQYYR